MENEGSLYFHSLRAEPSIVTRGDRAKLVWEGGAPEAEYTVLANGAPHPKDNPPSGGIWYSAPLDDDTEFTVETRVIGPNGTPCYRRLTTAVIVRSSPPLLTLKPSDSGH